MVKGTLFWQPYSISIYFSSFVMDFGFFFFCYWSQWDHEKCVVSHSLRSASEIPGNVNRVHSSVLFTMFPFQFLNVPVDIYWKNINRVTCCSFQYTFRAVVEMFRYLASVCDQSPTHCLLTDFILTTSRSFSLRRRRVKAGNVTWVHTWRLALLFDLFYALQANGHNMP